MRIVHVVPRDFRVAEDGGKIKTNSLASALAAQGELHVVDMGKYPLPDACPVMPIDLPFGGSAERHSLFAASASLGVPAWLFRASCGLRARLAHQLIGRLAPDVVVADEITCARLVVGLRQAQRIVHLHNVESDLHEQIGRHNGKRRFTRRAQTYRRLEQRLLPRADQVWGVRESDAQYYRGLGCRSAHVVPNAVAPWAFDPAPVVGEPGRALYFGSLWWGPNADSVRELAAIAGRLATRRPDYRFVITGRGAGSELQALLDRSPSIEALGFVPSLVEEARRAAVVVLPVTWGGGTKIKTIEALALGKPVLTTPEGAVGLDIVDGEHAVIREAGEAFERALTDMLDVPQRYQDMALRGQRHAAANFSQAAIDRIVGERLHGG